MIIDSQVHAYAADSAQRPWKRQLEGWPAHVTGDEMITALDEAGVDGAILVSIFALYRYDDSYACEVQRSHPGRFALVKPVDPEDPAAAERVAEWKKTPGAVGIRIMMRQGLGHDPHHAGVQRIASAAARHGLPVNLMCWGRLDAAALLIDRHPETRFVIDHLGLDQGHAPPAPTDAWAQLPQVLDLAKRPNAVVKVSGTVAMSRQPFPFADLWDPLARIFDAWGVERCLWGTDWTRLVAFASYPQAVKAFRLGGRLSPGELDMVMGEACARTYGWRPTR